MNTRLTFTTGSGYTRTGERLSFDDAERAAELTRGYLARTFGGYTEMRTRGGHINLAGVTVHEEGFRWVVIAFDPSEAEDTAAFIARAFDQGAVLLEVELLPTPAALVTKSGALL